MEKKKSGIDTASLDFTLAKKDHYVTESDIVLEVYENERFDLQTRTWGPHNLKSTDPKRYQHSSGQSDVFPEPPVPEGFAPMGDWEIDQQASMNEGSWSYNTNFVELDLMHVAEKSAYTVVRRRRWIRRIECIPQTSEEPIVRSTRSGSAASKAMSGTDSPASKSPASESFLSRAFGLSSASRKGSIKDDDRASDLQSLSMDDDVLDCEVEYEEDSVKDSDSVYGDGSGIGYANYIAAVIDEAPANKPTPMPTAPPVANAPPPVKKRNSFFSVFSSSSSSTATASAAAPTASSASSSGTSASTSVPPTAATSSVYTADPALRIQSSTLTAIGKQIKFLEAEGKKAEEARRKAWKDNEKPRLEVEISALEKKAAALKSLLEKEAARGESIAALDEELRKVGEQLDQLKRMHYFPFSAIRLGQGGVYLGLQDFWLEYASGSFSLEISTEKGIPVIKVQLMGTHDNLAAGVAARAKLEGFKLVGDKGSGVPKLAFDNLTVTVAFSVTLRLHYDAKSAKWMLPKSDFKLKIISFKGPYGLNGSIVSLVVSLLTPTIRYQLLSIIPFELGLLVRTLPCPTVIRGQFHVNGVELSLLSTEWQKSKTLARMCRYSTQQMEMFYCLQKALDRSPTMKTVQDLIAYIRAHRVHGNIWKQLLHLWGQAEAIYCEKIQALKLQEAALSPPKGHPIAPSVSFSTTTSSSSATTSFEPSAWTISFNTFITICDELLRKRVSTHFKLQHVESQISVNHLLSFIFQIIERVIQENINKSSNDLQRLRLMSLADRIRENYQYALEILRMVAKNLDFAQLGITACLHSGSDGYLEASVKEILAQAPLLLQFNFSKEKNIGALPLVPYILSVKPQTSGDVVVEIYHFTHDSHDVQDLEGPSSEPSTSVRGSVEDELSSAGGGGMRSYASQNIRTGAYSTSYNRVVTSIANLKANTNLESGGSSSATGAGTVGGLGGGLVLRTGHGCDIASLGPGVLRREASRGVSASQEHLFVREEERQRQLHEILNDHPIGGQADTVLGVTASSPHISFIVDKATTLKPGAELFTLLLGPQKEDWKPFGSPNMFAEDEAAEALARSRKDEQREGFIPADYEQVTHDHPTHRTKQKPGCPIMVQTSPGIKLLAQIPSLSVNVALPSLVRFFLAHFVDMQLLKAYLESLLGGEFFEEQLTVIKVIVEKVASYLLVSGLDVEVNLNGKIVTLNGEIMVRIDTPNEEEEDMRRPQGNDRSSTTTNCAIELKAQLSLKQLLEDSLEIEAFLNKAQQQGPNTITSNNNTTINNTTNKNSL